MYTQVFNEIMREYEITRDQVEASAVARRDEVYNKLPRVREIDELLAVLGASAAKWALSGDRASLTAAREKTAQLRDEKQVLLSDAGIPVDYAALVHACETCCDTGYVAASDGVQAHRCACLKQRLIEAHYALSSLKDVLARENFDTFDVRFYSTEILAAEGISPYENIQSVYRIALRFVENFNAGAQNLLLYGETGLGKTFLCNCIAKDILDAGHTVLYVTSPRLFRVIEDFRFNRDALTAPEDMLEAVTQVDLLILDDLGAEFSTVVTNAALFDMVNQRLLEGKSTVISTNLSLLELQAQYSERIASRFMGNYQTLKFFGDDIRLKKKYGGRG